MENAKVILFENSNSYARAVIETLRPHDHTVEMWLAGIHGAREFISTENLEEFDIAIVDDDLTPGKYSGEEGNEIVGLIREVAPHVRIIGHTTLRFVEGADEQITKMHTRELVAAIDGLERPKTD